MVFNRGRNLRPINSIKNVTDTSGIIAPVTNTSIIVIISGVRNADLATTNEVDVGASISSIFLELFFISEGGELATEVPLVDWYIIKDPGNAWGTTFNASNLPTPGVTGSHINKRHILHEEKGLSGGGNLSLAGVPMVFKGVIRIPRGRQRWGESDVLRIAARANFNTKFCVKAVYKWFK